MDITKYRTKHGLSQADFAALLVDPPATQAAVSHWETGRRRITADRAVQIERATKGQVKREALLWPKRGRR